MSKYDRAIVAAAYWLDASPHERTEEDGLILAQAVRDLIDDLAWYERRLRHLPGNHRQPKNKTEWIELIELFQDAGKRARDALEGE